MRENYTKPERIFIKDHAELDELWIQELIAEDPEILGLGDLVLKDKERIQPRAGRLDLLLQDVETNHRYEVEIQLGSTDESHIIRSIEYYDIERSRYPQYEHCGVLVAEDITSRFLNVIKLFNGTIPFIAIQMQVYAVADKLTVIFTKVLDELKRGLIDEDEDAQSVPTDRAYWDSKSSKDVMRTVDDMANLLLKIDPELKLNYNKFYIGIEKHGKARNFVRFRPKKEFCHIDVKMPSNEESEDFLNNSGLTWGTANQYYRINRLRPSEFDKKIDTLTECFRQAYDSFLYIQ